MRRPATQLAAAGLLLLGFAACGGSGDERPKLAETNQGWKKLPRLPASIPGGAQDLHALTLGRRVVVVAGAAYTADRMVAAIFRTSARAWAAVPRAPLRWRARYSATSTGREVIVWGGAGDRAAAYADGARLDPGKRAWRVLPAGPLQRRHSHSAVWTGAKMLIWGGIGGNGRGRRDGASFDPRTGRWRRIASAPIMGSRDQSAVWTGTTLFVVSRGRAASFQPRSSRWKRLPAVPGQQPVTLAWTGRDLLAWTGEKPLLMRPGRSPRWRTGATFPGVARGPEAALWARGRLYVWGGLKRRCGDCWLRDGATYDPRRGAWRPLPAAPLRARYRHAVAPLDGGVFVWGGCCARDEQLSDGATYRAGATG